MGCHPEAISEGGFVYINAPGYKSMRIQLYAGVRIHKRADGVWTRYARGSDRVEREDAWPMITPATTPQEWRGNTAVIIHAGQRITTCLKAFDGAPAYTNAELAEWKAAFGAVGIECSKMPKMPT